MKSLPVSADLVTCLLTGPTRQRANPIFHQKVRQTSQTLYPCQHVSASALWWRACSFFRTSNLSRICIPAVSRRELCSGPDWCLHSGRWQALPVCLQSHHQRQACKLCYSVQEPCVLSRLPNKYKTCTNVKITLAQVFFVFVCVIVSQKTGNFSTAGFVFSVQTVEIDDCLVSLFIHLCYVDVAVFHHHFNVFL